MITQTGTLKFGVEFEGAVHTDFELRLPMISDNIDALEEVGAGSNLKVHVAIMARTLLRLGTIAPDKITYELLSKNMIDDDFDVLAAEEKALKKRRLESNQPSPTTDSPSPSSPATESPNPVSAS